MKIQFLSKSLKDKLRVTCKLRWGVTCKVSRGFRLRDSRGFSGVYYRNIPGNRKSDFISKTASNQVITTFDQRFTKEIPGVSRGFPGFPGDSRGFTGIHGVSRGFTGIPGVSQGFSGIPEVSRDFTKEIYLGIENLISLVKPRVTNLSRRLINVLLRKSPGFPGDPRGLSGLY